MHWEGRLWKFTEGLRWRIAAAVGVGLVGVSFGLLRLAILGWLIGRIFAGDGFDELLFPMIAAAVVMCARSGFEYVRAMMAHRTAAAVQARLRRTVHDKITELGPAFLAGRRSGDITLTLVDGIEQLETYFGKYLPQLLVTFLTPVLIFGFIAFIDLAVASTLLVFALIAIFAPALWHAREGAQAAKRQTSYGNFAAEFLDSIQGLSTLKAFGQSVGRAASLDVKAKDLARKTLWVLGTNVMARGLTDAAIASGAAAALAVGVWRIDAGVLDLGGLLIIMMMGVEIFRPMRDLRTVLHEGMVGRSAAYGLYNILEAEAPVADTAPALPSGAPSLEPTIAFHDVRFAYPGRDRIVHDGLNFEIRAGERVGLVGPSGCGKSSVVRLVLRFFDPVEGRVTLGGQDLRDLPIEAVRSMISVINQDTFLFHGTVAENLRMGDPEASEEAMIQAARAANIHEFISGLSDGYDTVIGEKGIKLSGGQRQRVAIARALLRDTPILVLDEALSAVDAENEAVIQEALDRLMRGRTTLILAHRLSSIIDCDRILVLDHGRVIESGPHDTLMAKGGVYARLMAEQAQDSAEDDVIIDDTVDEDAPVSRREYGLEKPAPTEGIIAAEGLGWFGLFRELMSLAMPWKGLLAITVSLGILRVLAFIGVGVLSALVILGLKNGSPVGPLLIALGVTAPVAGLLHWLESWLAHDMAFRLLAEMRVETFRRLDRLAPAYLVRRRTGDLMGLATQDVELIEYFFAHTMAPAVVAVLVPVAVFLTLGAESLWLALALAPFIVLVAASPMLSRDAVERLGSRAREAEGELAAFAVDSVQGVGEIVSFQQERQRGEQFEDLTRRHIQFRLPFFAEATFQNSLIEALTSLGGLSVVVVGAFLSSSGAIDPGVLPLLTVLAMAAFLPVSEISQLGSQLAETLGATRRVYALVNEPVRVRDGPGVDGREARSTAAGLSMGLHGVRFAYPGGMRAALSDLSLEIPAGATVALVGTSGAGKTTTAQLLMRFWDPDEGRVTLNGVDLKDYELDDLRSRIALVSQDTYLFNDTLAANIRIAKPDATEAEIADAIANASLQDLVATLPDGLEGMVGERGTALSGGQRQRVAIARAFLKDAPILILDEATSHLDAVNERAVRTALERLKEDRTTIIIAHRLSTIRDADVIAVLDQGRLVEAGTHDALLASRGLYARLVSRQLAVAAQ